MADGYAHPTGVQPAEGNVGLILTFDVLVQGNDVPSGFTYYPSAVTISAKDTALAIRSKVSTQVISDASSYGITLPAGNLTLPNWQKG